MAEDIYARLGRNIKAVRESKNMTTKELAHAAGLSNSFIINIENCRRKPSLGSVENIVKALGITFDSAVHSRTKLKEETWPFNDPAGELKDTVTRLRVISGRIRPY